LVEGLRQIKDNNELQKIKKAIMITLAAYRYIQKFLKPGIREIEIVGEIERFIHRHGARACAFEIIVASGPHAAYPHHVTSNRKLQNNEMVLIDMGVDYQGYKSDLTRTFFLGRIKPLANKVYTIVEQTQSHVVKLIRPGILSRELDAAARQYIWRQGYGPFFSHNLGHGVGLEIHEAPFLSSKSQTQLEAGMVFTVEPGIYLAGRLGVRIEDMVLVTDKGAQVL
jgi:Xaa-Pro aminopeptidase